MKLAARGIFKFYRFREDVVLSSPEPPLVGPYEVSPGAATGPVGPLAAPPGRLLTSYPAMRPAEQRCKARRGWGQRGQDGDAEARRSPPSYLKQTTVSVKWIWKTRQKLLRKERTDKAHEESIKYECPHQGALFQAGMLLTACNARGRATTL